MVSTQPPVAGQLSIVTQTLLVKNGKTLRGLKPDKDGVYRNVPLAILGKSSRNGVMYETASMLKAMHEPVSRFSMKLQEGNLEGEWGHPIILPSAPLQDMLTRMTQIDRTRTSHRILSVRQTPIDGGLIMVLGDVKPWGPYGKYLQESFEDSQANTSFSLRAVTDDVGAISGGMLRRVRMLVTFDAVDAPGFEESSKRYMTSTEALHDDFIYDVPIQAPITMTDVCAPDIRQNLFSTENITDQQILDLFKTDVVTVCNERLGVIDPKTGNIIRANGQKAQTFHTLFGKIH